MTFPVPGLIKSKHFLYALFVSVFLFYVLSLLLILILLYTIYFLFIISCLYRNCLRRVAPISAVPPFPVWSNVQEYTFHLYAALFTHMALSNCALTVRDRHIVLGNKDAGERAKRCWHCPGSGMTLSHCVHS